MHKETGGKIDIVIESGDTEDLLKIIITDNGVGRAKAAELKSKSAIKRKSFGMKITSERIALINQLFNTNTTVQITDLRKENGDPCGTQVILQIPI
jgi:sensor histidine kinase YesM